MNIDPADPPLLAVLKGEYRHPAPLWLMRQAGRYLPEYRALRAEKGGFLELVYDSDAAAEITLQPIRRFGLDGAILFSDILIVPHAIGQTLTFGPGEGPQLSPALIGADWRTLEPAPHYLTRIYETVAKVRAQLDPSVTMLGFAGSPWTVATYMVAGHGSKDHAETRQLAYQDPQAFQELIDKIVAVTVEYLSGQIEAGAQAIQLFDSWAGSLSPAQFEQWIIAPNAAITSQLKARHPDTPVIGFPKGAGAKLVAYATETGVDAVGLDETLDPEWANAVLPKGMPVQGNLDPLALMAGGPALVSAVERIRKAFAGRPHVFNLGHGIGQFTPIDHVETLVELVRRPL
ncbi:uroporphyrinogen decarboxylase [Polymorphobacter sp.]|uniref:uroporphyrinogen decarboxylase n=1 Tax=Polymorphobacter sp. TaxID=1909290 RepID=UPI003F6FD26D